MVKKNLFLFRRFLSRISVEQEEVFSLSSPSTQRRRDGFSTFLYRRLLWGHRAIPSPTLDKTTNCVMGIKFLC